ncbi:hypothetical protein B0T10DRAFT_411533 [Thelonectria olida]|uniref:F-box domain-containing protein n=1 Tax=Thelonectria olida TaxID=1576542 RepID=A0A9P8VWM8_9HYPO|nr:hypothetical protein B0T10DRAFT_411533 [Thelonectria olida]
MGINRERQIERWWLLAPQKKQRIMLPNHDNTTCWDLSPKYFCTYYLSFNAFKLLCDSLGNTNIKTKEHLIDGLNQVMPRKAARQSQLEKLPSELLGTLFHILEAKDFVSLSLCSQTLWNHAITWAQNGFRRWRNEYSWAGTPIICTGTHLHVLPQLMYDMFPEAKPGPQPQGLTPRQKKRRRAEWEQASDWNYFVTSRYNKSPLPYDEGYREEFWKVISSAGIPENLHKLIAACFPTLEVEHGSKWYLRNLTQKEYIRMELITTADGEVTVALEGKPWLTLDILLMWLISWNQKRDGTTFTWEELNERGRVGDDFMLMRAGIWAAHALDVVDEEMGEGWFDRTDTIDRLSNNWLRALYRAALARKDDEDVKEYWAKLYEE